MFLLGFYFCSVSGTHMEKQVLFGTGGAKFILYINNACMWSGKRAFWTI